MLDFRVALSTITADSFPRSMRNTRIHFGFILFLFPTSVSIRFEACTLRSIALLLWERLDFEEKTVGWQAKLSSCRSSVNLRPASVKCLLHSGRNLGLGVNGSYPAVCILALHLQPLMPYRTALGLALPSFHAASSECSLRHSGTMIPTTCRTRGAHIYSAWYLAARHNLQSSPMGWLWWSHRAWSQEGCEAFVLLFAQLTFTKEQNHTES